MLLSPDLPKQPRSRPQDRSLQQRWSQTWQLWPSRPGPDFASHSLDGFWQDLRSRYQEPHRIYHTLAHLADCFNHWDALLAQVPIGITDETGAIGTTDETGAIGTIGEIMHWTPLDFFCLEMALWCHDAVYTVTVANTVTVADTDTVANTKTATASNTVTIGDNVTVTAGKNVTVSEKSPDQSPRNSEHLPLTNEAQSAQWAGQWLQKLGVGMATIDRIQTLIQATAHSQAATHKSTPHNPDRVLPWLLDLDLAILGANPAAFQRYEAQIRQEYAALSDLHFHQGRRALIQQLLQQPWLYHTSHCRHQWEPQARRNLRQYLR